MNDYGKVTYNSERELVMAVMKSVLYVLEGPLTRLTHGEVRNLVLTSTESLQSALELLEKEGKAE